MEGSIFPEPEIAERLKRSFVEVRLHMDTPQQLKDPDRVVDYQERLADSIGIPIYLIVDPEKPEVKLEQFNGKDRTEGVEFAKFLDRNAT
jgi:hypothetical protein